MNEPSVEDSMYGTQKRNTLHIPCGGDNGIRVLVTYEKYCAVNKPTKVHEMRIAYLGKYLASTFISLFSNVSSARKKAMFPCWLTYLFDSLPLVDNLNVQYTTSVVVHYTVGVILCTVTFLP